LNRERKGERVVVCVRERERGRRVAPFYAAVEENLKISNSLNNLL